MKAWPSLTDTSVVKTYREASALKNCAFRDFARFHPSLRFFGMGRLLCAPTVFG